MTADLLMTCCLLVDVEAGEKDGVVWRAVEVLGASPAGSVDMSFRETMRFDFDEIPSRAQLLWLCGGALRAATIVDAELEWLVGEPIGPGRLMWTLTETSTGDQHAPD